MMFLFSNIVGANRDAFVLSFGMVSLAEMFDKTWFVALVMAMRYEKHTVFWACFAGLFVHVFIAAGLGWSVAQFFSQQMTNFLAAAIYGIFAVLYAYDWYISEEDTDLFATGKEEVTSSMPDGGLDTEAASYGTVKDKKTMRSNGGKADLRSIFLQCFLAVFLAEWGDRTQIAMVGVHASQPLIPVMCGSTLAFGLLTLSAVTLGSFFGNQSLNESMVKAVCSISFAFFTVLAIHDGLVAHGQQPLMNVAN